MYHLATHLIRHLFALWQCKYQSATLFHFICKWICF
uniref:Uncharacterized protein n=1 Tax=Rhizophora mucronata TaxID=61149 RepID=A0A2P2P4G5_RHIMU